jgi:thymidylate kinase
VSGRPSAGDAMWTRSATTTYVAIEGPCCAGKTTLARGLLGCLADLAVCSVPCYADHVGGGRFLPPPVPSSLAEDEAGLHALLMIENDRLAGPRAGQYDAALLDRSVHTLLAHRYAIDQLTGLGCYEPASKTLSLSSAPAWPRLVLFLDVSQGAVEERNRGKFPADSLFIDARFNSAIRRYYESVTASGDAHIVWLDGELDAGKVVDSAETQIRALLRRPD